MFHFYGRPLLFAFPVPIFKFFKPLKNEKNDGNNSHFCYSPWHWLLSRQKSFKRHCCDAQTNAPISGALVVLGNQQTLTNENGLFGFPNLEAILPSAVWVTAAAIRYLPATETGTYSLTPISLFLQPLEVKSIRASDKAPFTKTNIGKEAIAKQNLGQDIPFLLNQTPSVVVNSDAGNGVGYTQGGAGQFTTWRAAGL